MDDIHTEAEHEPEAEIGAKQRLRAFEDEALGEDAPRISGHVERGHGSLFSRMTSEQKAEHASLERLVKAEERVAEASAKLAEAHAELEKAEAGVKPSAPAEHVDGGE